LLMATPTDRSAATRGMPLAVVWRPIDELKNDPKNSHSHSREQIRQLAKSIAAFGFNVPVLVGAGCRIIAGYGRLLAARQLGWSVVPTILQKQLSPAQARAFRLADARLAETASWDDLLLAMRLKELSPAEPEFGEQRHRPSERPHRKVLPDRARKTEGGAANLRPAEEVPLVHEGDLWLLGNHRIHCGNADNIVAEMLAEKEGVVVFAPNVASADAIIRCWQTLTGGIARCATSGRRPVNVDLPRADALAGN